MFFCPSIEASGGKNTCTILPFYPVTCGGAAKIQKDKQQVISLCHQSKSLKKHSAPCPHDKSFKLFIHVYLPYFS